jgi:hypothetical protein
VLEETMGVLVSDDRERRPDGFEQGFSPAGRGLAQEAYTVEPTSYLAFSAKLALLRFCELRVYGESPPQNPWRMRRSNLTG